MLRLVPLCSAFVLLLAQTALAQTTYQWTNSVAGVADGSWSAGANWRPAGPAAGVDNTAQFTQPVTNTATLTLDGNFTVGNLLFGNTATNAIGWTINAGTPSTSVLALSVFSGAPTVAVTNQSATLGAVLAGSQGFTKTGGGVLNLNAADTYTGLTTVSAGALVLNDLNAIAAGNALNIANGAVVQPKQSGTYANVTTTLNGSSRANSSFGGSLDIRNPANTSVTWPGQIILNAADATIGSYGVNDNTTLSGQLTGSGGLTIRPEGGSAAGHTAVFTLSNPNNNYAGSTIMQVGTAEASATLKSGVNNALPVTTSLNLDRAGSSGVVYFDLAGHNQTLAGLMADFGSNAVINSSGTVATLTVSNSVDTAFNGAIGATAKAGINLVKQGAATLTLNGVNLYTGGTTLGAGTLALNGLITATSGLLMSNATTLQIGLGAPGGPTNIVVNGNITLAGQIDVSDYGIVSNTTYPVIYYTGNLTNHGLAVAPFTSRSSCVFTIDTTVPHLVRLVVAQTFPLVQLSNTNFNVSTLTTNLSGFLRGSPVGPIWYEVRDQTNKLWDFGATLAVTPWNITVRHLRAGTNTVTMFAQDGSGIIQGSSVQLALNLGSNPGVRPRPIPSEIWWGGLSDNTQMTNFSQWPFVEKFEDGYFMHGSGWNASINRGLMQQLANNLAQFNNRYWMEIGGGHSSVDTNTGNAQANTYDPILANDEATGIIFSEITHDYHMENMKPDCQVNPTWPANDQIAFWTGDLTVADGTYPYGTGIWRDAFNGYYAQLPHLKVGITSQPEYWPWDSYPAEVVNQISFTVTNPTTAFSFNAHDIIRSFANMAGAIGHPYFSLQSDSPWNWFGTYSDPAAATLMRQKIRVYEDYLQSRDCRHTLICNVGNASAANQGSTNAANLYYESSSLSNMYVHQQEGGRANRYLYEGWYFGIPYAVVPETQAGSYTHLALTAIKYLKGIADTNGNLEQLKLGLLSTGTTNKFSITNNGDVACLPAITASESGSGYLVARYFNAAGQDVTAAMLNGEGYCHTNMLPPGQSTTFTVVVSALSNAAPSSTRSITFEAFWNPQDPTGVVRDRKTISVTASNLVSAPNPLAWYKLDGNANDSSGNNFNGTASGVSYVTGIVGAQAASFNGTSSYLQIPRSISNDFAIAFWVKTTQTGGAGQWYAGKGLVDGEVSGATSDFGVSLTGASAAFGVGNPDTTITSTAPINDGQWHHVAAIRANSSGAMNLYVDGVWQASATGPTGTRTAPSVLRLGSLATATNFFSGTLDDVRLYGSALNGAQVAALASLTPVNTAPTLMAIPDQTLVAGQTLTLTNSASDPDSPPQKLAFELVGAPAGMALNATNGVLTWRPTVAQSPAVNAILVVVTDNGAPALSATQSFSVCVSRPVLPAISQAAVTNGVFSLLVGGDSGPDYLLLGATNLNPPVTWLPLKTNLAAVPPFGFTDTGATNFNRRFYRVLLGP